MRKSGVFHKGEGSGNPEPPWPKTRVARGRALALENRVGISLLLALLDPTPPSGVRSGLSQLSEVKSIVDAQERTTSQITS